MITIYGSPKSSAGRCFWCLEEAGVTYETKSIDFRASEHKSEAFLKINRNGKVPALVDGDFSIWESLAINNYIADAYKPELLGTTAQERGLISQWSIWSVADLQVPMIDAFIQLVFVPEPHRNADIIAKAFEKIPVMLSTLEEELEGKEFLVADRFTLADLNVSFVVGICDDIKFDLAEYKNINEWRSRIANRDGAKRYKALCA
ncbi:glutathione S-transferase family protein [Neptunomonas qingdaonensis]|uniref:Glutathione S-transferase n=1 Tax=Neptunomonas qingdaonensis TaxID=1045558 RepID=A0A1I2QZY4_9GAMM|nr:glutathione S-transferase family protein [Neptunomonas qingdaonensis]SFG31261.1 glutathione S-transferase [Neptunomonas qingdaonensis]